jgi:hypothetical protein
MRCAGSQGPSACVRQLYAGDQVLLTVVSGRVTEFLSTDSDVRAFRSRTSRQRELALDIAVNDQPMWHVRSAKGVLAGVTWIAPTPAMTSRGVQRRLELAASTEPGDIQTIPLEPGSRVMVQLSESPNAEASVVGRPCSFSNVAPISSGAHTGLWLPRN